MIGLVGFLTMSLLLFFYLFDHGQRYYPYLFIGSVGILAMLFLCYFFRDPERKVPPPEQELGGILAPSDGTVLRVEKESNVGPDTRHGYGHRIYVYLSPLDVHVNRVPCSGTVSNIKYMPGTFALAWTDKASKENESCLTEIRDEHTGDIIGVRQVAGRLAQQIINDCVVGQRVTRGEKFGIIRFGSQVEISVPRHYKILCSAGDRLVGGETFVCQRSKC